MKWLVAIAFSLLTIQVNAATATLNGTSGNSCSYSIITITPAGLTATCKDGGATIPMNSPGSFSFAAAAVTGQAHTNVPVTIQRVSGAVGPFDLYYWFEGSGCARDEVQGPVRFADGDAADKTILIPTGASGLCTVGLGTPPAPATLGVNRSAVITVAFTLQRMEALP